MGVLLLPPHPSQHARWLQGTAGAAADSWCVCMHARSRGGSVTHLSAGQYVSRQLDLGEVSLADGLE